MSEFTQAELELVMRALDELEGYDRDRLHTQPKVPYDFERGREFHIERLERISALRVKIYNREDYQPTRGSRR